METPYRVVIVDDEPLARDIVVGYVSKVPELQILAVCENAVEALEAIHTGKPDLVFLDIQMPGMTGLELIEKLPTDRPEIVLTTAFGQHGAKSYDLGVLDYLMKPIDYPYFLRSIAKFKEKRALTAMSEAKWNLVSTPQNDASIWLRDGKRVIQIPNDEIFYVESVGNYVKVHCADQMLMTHMILKQAEAVFSPPSFVRIHRSFIVRVAAIRVIDGNHLMLSNGTKLGIGPHYRDEIKKHIPFLR